VIVDAYVAGGGPATYEAVEQAGFAWNRFAANRELVEWMRRYNADPGHAVKVSFYGTLPSEQETTESPRRALEFALAYRESVDRAGAVRHRDIIEPLLGADADWEDSAGLIHNEIIAGLLGGTARSEDPAVDGAARPLGLSAKASAVRLAMENLAFELQVRRAELASKSDRESFNEALHGLSVARNLLALHAALARRESLDTLVTMRDAMAAEHLVHIAALTCVDAARCTRGARRGDEDT